MEAEAGTLEGSAYLGDVATLFAGYAAVRDRLGLADRHAVARGAIDAAAAPGAPSGGRGRSSSTASTTSPATSST